MVKQRVASTYERYLESLYPDADSRAEFERRVHAVHVAADFLEAIEQVRAATGVSKVNVALRMKRHPASIGRLLTSADANPTLTTIIELLEAMDISLKVMVESQPQDPTERRAPIVFASNRSIFGPRRPVPA